MNRPPPSADTPPKQRRVTSFGNYRVQGLIGKGSFATVYQAELRGEFGFRKQVALKVLHKTARDFAERETMEFLREARLGAYIRHPNLVEFYECGRVHDRLYIAMELVTGPNLSQLMRLLPDRVDRLDERAILVIAQQTARGLQALHEATIKDQHIGAIHRDLKPANILLGTQGQAKIADYGITRFAADFYRTAGVEEIRGSPLYMSPEQARGEQPSQASDVFSYGVVILSLLVGHPIFEARTLDAVLRRVQDAEVGPALSLGRQRAARLVDVLQVCLEHHPDARYPNATALMRALRNLDPPPFGEEYIAELAKWGQERLEESRRTETVAPGDTLGTPIPAGERTELPFDLDEDLLPFGEPMAADDEDAITVDTTPWDDLAPGRPEVRRTRVLVWMLVVVCLVFASARVAATLYGAFGPATRDAVEVAGDEETGDELEATIPPVEDIEELTATEPADTRSAEANTDSDAATTPEPRTPRLHHTPLTREIRGEPIRCPVRVTPPGEYRATIRYRGSRWDPWQYSSTTSAPDGTLELVVPYGAWFTENATVVEYFIEVEVPTGEIRSGSSEQPHRVRLY